MASFWLHTALLVPLSAFAGAAWLCHRTPDLSGVKTTLQPKETAVQDLASVVEQTAIKQAGAMEISESELNDYLQRRLTASQTGLSAAVATFDRVIIDLEEGQARVNLCWTVLGHATVARVDLTVLRTKGDFTVEILKGAYGRLEVGRGLLLPLSPTLEKVVAACKPEISALFKMPNIRLAKDKLVLDPKF